MQSTELQEYVRERVTIDADTGCWIWKLSVDAHGYGFCGLREYRNKAHRISYMAFKGEILDGMQVDHLCRVRRCVNPEHLEQVTPRGNVRRASVARMGRPFSMNYVESSNLWRAIYTLQSSPRKRKILSSRDHDTAASKMMSWMSENPGLLDLS